jgi:cell division septation protein DedD
VIRRGEAPGPGKNVYINKSYDGSSLLNLPGNTRIVPRHVYENGNHEILPIPQGYMPAWQDDRLNPYRAWQTVDGYRATQQVWTNTVPRQLAAKVRNHGLKDARVAYRTSHQAATRLQAEQARTPRISTRGAAVQTRSARFVEVGLFSTSAKAAEAAARLRAAGLPVRQQGARHAGEAMTRVSVGPYASVAALTAGLGAVRATGYTSAYTR